MPPPCPSPASPVAPGAGLLARAKALGKLAKTDPKSASAADLALIVTVTKMLDPTSVAREGEVKLTQSSASLVDSVLNMREQIEKGQTILPAAQREALLNMVETLMPSYSNAYQKRARDAYTTAKEYGFSPKRVMQGFDFSQFDGEEKRDAAIRSASGNPWPTIRAGVAQQAPQAAALTPDEQAELEALRAELGQR